MRDHEQLNRWGIASGYQDVQRRWHDVPDETLTAVLEEMGAGDRSPHDVSGPDSGRRQPVTIRSGRHLDTARILADAGVVGPWQLRTESGDTIDGDGALPPELETGYHEFISEQGPRRLIVSPVACPSADQLKWWGWALQLYALRSARSWGIGDLGDLKRFGKEAGAQGADFVLLNPLHATLPGNPQQASPYFPSSREFRNPIYLDIDAVVATLTEDDRKRVRVELDVLGASSTWAGNRIDRDVINDVKFKALELIWRNSTPPTVFDHYVKSQGGPLYRYATFCMLSEIHGRPWIQWPIELRNPGSRAVAAAAKDHADRVQFHAWLQWLVEVQLADAGEQISLMHDLAIGVDPAGADAWLWQDAYALNMRVGAPPDEFNTRGQDWGLPPFDPWKLRAHDYEPFIGTVRAGLRHAGGLRIDHVMGLFRLFWIPENATPREGTYVHYPSADLLAIVALEAERAGAYVVGEDLGTVEPYMREALASDNILSYRLLWFEDQPPPHFPCNALAAITTHDLPTVAGLWDGSDLERQHDLGMEPNESSTLDIRNKVRGWLEVSSDEEVAVVADRAHDLLAQAPSVMVSVTLEDVLGIVDRPNYPGTVDEYPNWSVPLPQSLENIVADQRFHRVSRAMDQRHIPSQSAPPEAS